MILGVGIPAERANFMTLASTEGVIRWDISPSSFKSAGLILSANFFGFPLQIVDISKVILLAPPVSLLVLSKASNPSKLFSKMPRSFFSKCSTR